jgi:hypothetical protein
MLMLPLIFDMGDAWARAALSKRRFQMVIIREQWL